MPDKVNNGSECGRLIVVDPSVASEHMHEADPLPGWCEWFQVTRLGVIHLATRQTPVFWLDTLPTPTSLWPRLSTARLTFEVQLVISEFWTGKSSHHEEQNAEKVVWPIIEEDLVVRETAGREDVRTEVMALWSRCGSRKEGDGPPASVKITYAPFLLDNTFPFKLHHTDTAEVAMDVSSSTWFCLSTSERQLIH